MMKIDQQIAIKKGDRVKFRNGDTATITEIETGAHWPAGEPQPRNVWIERVRVQRPNPRGSTMMTHWLSYETFAKKYESHVQQAAQTDFLARFPGKIGADF